MNIREFNFMRILIILLVIFGLFLAFFVVLPKSQTEAESENSLASSQTAPITEDVIDPSEWFDVDTLPTEVTTPVETTELDETIKEPTVEDLLGDVEAQWGESAIYIAKTVWGEARGCSIDNQRKVIWCILNRVDHKDFPDTIIEVICAKNQFHGYYESNPVTEEMYNMALEIITLWQLEKLGEPIVRDLGPTYVFFRGSSEGNIFREEW